MADVVTLSRQQKLSRYRSQRKPEQSLDNNHDPLPEAQSEDILQDESVARAKSRYRRAPNVNGSRPATARNDDGVANAPVWPQRGTPSGKEKLPVQTAAGPQDRQKAGGLKTYHERTVSPQARLGASQDDFAEAGQGNAPSRDASRARPAASVSNLPPRYNVRNEQSPKAQPVKPAATPVLVDGPPTADQIRATKSTSVLPRFDDDGDGTSGCFGLFKRKRGEAAPQNEKRIAPRPNYGDEPPTIKPGGGGIVPGTDAPVSAVNAGDRSVLVECGKSNTVFPVTPTTTPIDLIKSASVCMSERIDVKSAVLLESFGTVGIQRPLRQYEHIRDVLNSWDTDRQNTLILVDPGTGSSEAELSVGGAPKVKPDGRSWFMSFSQKVGKWDKRFITLHCDGQVTSQKDPDKPKDAINVCHLSDFDIYTPTQEKIRKKIRPPKKLCFAIKSQQKTSMFESTHDFVHFFCTGDRHTADDFYSTIQAWRSWYLVNVMGEGCKPKPADNTTLKKETSVGRAHRAGPSTDSGYQLGSFKPLMDMGSSEKRPSSSRSSGRAAAFSAGFTKSSSQFDTTASPGRRTSRARKQNPPITLNNKALLAEDEPLVNLARRPSMDRGRSSSEQMKLSPEEFLSSGLLGRTYSQRQREQNDRDIQKANAFVDGPSLLNNGYDSRNDEQTARRSLDLVPKRTHSSRAQNGYKNTIGGDLQRSGSRAKDMRRPLVDLAPQYRQPPQHSKKGRGYNPDALGPGNLIEAATSPEDPMGVPPSTDWRARNNSVANTSHVRTNSLSRNTAVSKSTRRPATSVTAFTGEGLLAGSQGQSGWGTGDKGRGVIDGSRAKGPMVDLNEPSKFVSGSLLNKTERQGLPVPIIDRSREDV